MSVAAAAAATVPRVRIPSAAGSRLIAINAAVPTSATATARGTPRTSGNRVVAASPAAIAAAITSRNSAVPAR